MSDQLAPHSKEAEEAVIAACIYESSAVARAQALISPEDFFRSQNAELYQACVDISERGETVTIPSLVSEMDTEAPDFEGWGGYLGGIIDRVPHHEALRIEDHAKVVRDKSFLRKGLSATQRAAEIFYAGGDTTSVYSGALAEILRLSPPSSDEPERMGWSEVFQNDQGIMVDIPVLDQKMLGLSKGKLTTVAGPSGRGKSLLAGQIALAAAETSRVLIISMEMSKKEYEERLVRNVANLDHRPDSEGDWESVVNAQAYIESLNISFWSRSRITIEQIRARATAVQADEGLDILVVDYLQLVQLPQGKENEATKIGMITSQLKQLAVELDIHVLLLAQMNRGAASEMRGRDATTKDCILTNAKYPIPFIESLKGSGSIEQDSDHVVFIATHPNCSPSRHVSIVLGKNRHGETGECLMVEDYPRSAFRRISEDEIYSIAKGDMFKVKALRIDQGLATWKDYDND
jgi:replicative DNA helicase